jgi:hypothetical protein
MAHDGYTGITTGTAVGVALTGCRSAFIGEDIGQDMQAADNELYPKGALSGGARASWGFECDKPTHGVAAGTVGTSSFIESQGATTKTTTCVNCVVTSIRRTATARGSGRGRSSIGGVAYSSDGATSPVTWGA